VLRVCKLQGWWWCWEWGPRGMVLHALLHALVLPFPFIPPFPPPPAGGRVSVFVTVRFVMDPPYALQHTTRLVRTAGRTKGCIPFPCDNSFVLCVWVVLPSHSGNQHCLNLVAPRGVVKMLACCSTHAPPSYLEPKWLPTKERHKVPPDITR
jgi:hypothetical protein